MTNRLICCQLKTFQYLQNKVIKFFICSLLSSFEILFNELGFSC